MYVFSTSIVGVQSAYFCDIFHCAYDFVMLFKDTRWQPNHNFMRVRLVLLKIMSLLI